MAGNKRQADVISLEQRRRKRRAQQLIAANLRMIEAEHALFVALRLAGGGRGGGNNVPAPLLPRPATIVPMSRMRARRKRAA
jgi:hypothetical protein